MTATPATPRRLIVLGCTGSIGTNTLNVVDHLNRTAAASIQVVGLAAGANTKTLIEQARWFKVKHVAIADAGQAQAVRQALPDCTVFAGPDAALQLVKEVEATDCAAAIVGVAGLAPTLEAIRMGLTISLSNKETLVAAGELVRPMLKSSGATIIPVDSEHSAIFQCLNAHHSAQAPRVNSSIKRIVLTASGGPFRTADIPTMQNATVDQALRHPTWSMGPKITIDSATMMNKTLEVIEAHWLFDLPGEKIDLLIHPESVVHSFVEFTDNSTLAQLGPPDMRTPIQYALTYPNRVGSCSDAMDWSTLRGLSFEPVDFARFKAPKLGYQVIRAGGTAGAVLNAANEAAVKAFLERRIPFGRIVELADEALSEVPAGPLDSLDAVMQADRLAREFVASRLIEPSMTPAKS
jgi:1-deoxy-D-xylulose-5-phosphate reductoisomerase